jgi:hypothetical protein
MKHLLRIWLPSGGFCYEFACVSQPSARVRARASILNVLVVCRLSCPAAAVDVVVLATFAVPELRAILDCVFRCSVAAVDRVVHLCRGQSGPVAPQPRALFARARSGTMRPCSRTPWQVLQQCGAPGGRFRIPKEPRPRCAPDVAFHLARCAHESRPVAPQLRANRAGGSVCSRTFGHNAILHPHTWLALR